MTCIMFWNVGRGSGVPYLQAACLENDVDLLILAEDTTLPGNTIAALNGGGVPKYEEYNPVPSKLRFYKRIGYGTLNLARDEGDRISLRTFDNAAGENFIIAAAHLPSKLHDKTVDQAYEARRLRTAIDEVERAHGHNRTLIIGDMNMNPFESGMIAADGLHGVMDASVASKNGRVYKGTHHNYFYNPMWSRLGDESYGPPGTYHYSGGGLENFHWNTFDQILLRPSLIPAYKNGKLSVITRIGTDDLMRGNRPLKTISDHLPLVLKLKLGVK